MFVLEKERYIRVMCMMCVYERVGERKTDLNTKPAPNLSPNTNTIYQYNVRKIRGRSECGGRVCVR